MVRNWIVLASTMLLGVGLLSAEVAGKYKVEIERPAGAARGPGGGGGGRGGFGAMQTTLDLKQDGSKLTGSAAMGSGERSRTVEITNGKIDGEKFSFETVFETPRGTMTMLWEGSVEGDTLKGKRSMKEFDRPPVSFTAKKAD